MVFAIVQLVCKAVPGHHVGWIIAVPQQHATFERFGQTGAAVHLALCKTSMPLSPALTYALSSFEGEALKGIVGRSNDDSFRTAVAFGG